LSEGVHGGPERGVFEVVVVHGVLAEEVKV
jgi:hypothetical protein